MRISAPSTYAHYRIFPLLPKFMALYPQVQVEIDVRNRNIDFVDENFDVAIRLGPPKDSNLVARKLEDARLGVFASPTFLSQHNVPHTLAELKHLPCIGFVVSSTGRTMPWLFREKGQ